MRHPIVRQKLRNQNDLKKVTVEVNQAITELASIETLIGDSDKENWRLATRRRCTLRNIQSSGGAMQRHATHPSCASRLARSWRRRSRRSICFSPKRVTGSPIPRSRVRTCPYEAHTPQVTKPVLSMPKAVARIQLYNNNSAPPVLHAIDSAGRSPTSCGDNVYSERAEAI